MAGESSIAAFNPNEDQHGIYPRWERWLRGFELFLLSKNITETQRKKAMLLHHDGMDLQDIFYAIPDCDVVIGNEDPYEKTKKVLTDYFRPKLNTTYERHLFRNMAQKEDETVGQFVTRLRQQAKYCKFASMDTEICDQIIEKGRSMEVRKRILEKGDIELKEAMEIAQAFETASVQTKAIGNNVVARITTKRENARGKSDSSSSSGIKCYRCGYRGHAQSDEKCPDRNKECTKYCKKGHFAAMCRTYRDRADKHGDGSDKRDKKEVKTNSSANKEERKSTTVKQLDMATPLTETTTNMRLP
ncbi:uncharacterized protein [Temnothorax longispinosus]|uniref:uncharacterized protein n=1 Tax=Temnothorax longispinosus TaxID=300112 RepID=UPI003A98F20A